MVSHHPVALQEEPDVYDDDFEDDDDEEDDEEGETDGDEEDEPEEDGWWVRAGTPTVCLTSGEELPRLPRSSSACSASMAGGSM